MRLYVLPVLGYPYKTVVESDLAGWERTVNINSRGVSVTALSFPLWKNKDPEALSISLPLRKTGGGLLGNAIYGASKTAVMSFSKGMAREGGHSA